MACLGRATAVAVAVAVAVLVPGTARADYIRDQEWHLAYLRIADAHRLSTGVGVTVGVIDTGVDVSHPDLVGNVLPGTVTYQGPGRGGDAWHDSNGHGTAMAGNIAAHGHGRNAGALGIAPGAKILPVADTVDAGTTNDEAMAAAIHYAVGHGARVLCIAQGGGTASPSLATAVRDAEDADVVVVAAAGNLSKGALAVGAPADLPGVVAVAAVDRAGNHTADSVTGPDIVLSAPGVDIVQPTSGGGYSKGTGTSDSAAFVAGAAALIRSKYPKMPATEVIHRLTATATDKGAPGRDPEYGYGVLNIVAALTADVPPLGASPSPSSSASPSPSASPPTTTVSILPPGKRTRGPSALLWIIPAVAVAGAIALFLGWGARRRGTG